MGNCKKIAVPLSPIDKDTTFSVPRAYFWELREDKSYNNHLKGQKSLTFMRLDYVQWKDLEMDRRNGNMSRFSALVAKFFLFFEVKKCFPDLFVGS